MNKNPIHVPNNKGAEDLSTKDLIRGLYIGYRFTFFEKEAVQELVKRGELEAIKEAYWKTTRKFVLVCIERALNIPPAERRPRRGGAK